MARIRTIKPEFWQDEDLASCSSHARLTAIGLLNMADDEGFFKAHPALIKAQIFPFDEDSVNIHGVLNELSNIGYISLFEGSDGKKYGLILGFTKHQSISRPSESKIKPMMPDKSLKTGSQCLLNEGSVNTHGVLHVGKEQGKEQGKEYITKFVTKEQICEIIDHLNMILKTSYRSSSRRTKELINARFRDGFNVDDFKHVHIVKFAEWNNTSMAKHLNPDTLYGPKFEKYRNQQLSDAEKLKIVMKATGKTASQIRDEMTKGVIHEHGTIAQ